MLQRAVEEGDLAAGQPLEVLAHVLLACADEAVLFIANASEPYQAHDQAVQALTALLAGIGRQHEDLIHVRVSHVCVLSVLTGRNRTLVP
jgi:hypothetical protein